MKKSIMAILSIIIALVIAGGEYVALKGQQKTYNVVIATQDIMPGEPLQGKTQIVQVNAQSNNLLQNPQGYAAVQIAKGSYITKEMIKESNNSNLKKVAIKTDETNSVAGIVKPGSYVDIGFIPKEQNGQQILTLNSGVILKHVQVVQLLDSDGNPLGHNTNAYAKSIPSSVVVAVSEDDAVTLKNAESQGTIYLIAY